MDYQERIEKLDGFIKKCDDFDESIIQIGTFNLNDGIDDSKSIDRRDSNDAVRRCEACHGGRCERQAGKPAQAHGAAARAGGGGVFGK